jgi:hypothetical protein
MTVTWLDTERRLAEALTYIGVVTADEKGEPWVVSEGNPFDGTNDVLVFNIAELARALEHIK